MGIFFRNNNGGQTPQPMWFKRRAFAQGRVFYSKNRNFFQTFRVLTSNPSYPTPRLRNCRWGISINLHPSPLFLFPPLCLLFRLPCPRRGRREREREGKGRPRYFRGPLPLPIKYSYNKGSRDNRLIAHACSHIMMPI